MRALRGSVEALATVANETPCQSLVQLNQSPTQHSTDLNLLIKLELLNFGNAAQVIYTWSESVEQFQIENSTNLDFFASVK